MRKYLILFFVMAITVWGFSIKGVVAEEGHHEEESEHHGEEESGHSAGSKATFTKEHDNYRYILSVSPEHPRTGEETELEFEIMDMRGAEENFGEGYPVVNAEVEVRIKELKTNQQVTVHAHAEGDAGVYGIHYKFPVASGYHLFLVVKKDDGSRLNAHFDIEEVEEGDDHEGEEEEGHHEEESEHHEEEESDHQGEGDHHDD